MHPEKILEKKSTLFSAVVLVLVGSLSIPIIIPHLFHGLHIVHIGLHVIGLTLAVFITVVAIMAFYRLKTKRLFLTTCAFASFIAAESFLMVDVTWPFTYYIGDIAFSEVGHILTIITLGLLSIGVFRND